MGDAANGCTVYAHASVIQFQVWEIK